MTTSQRELLMILAKVFVVNPEAFPYPDTRKRIVELLAEINAGSQELR